MENARHMDCDEDYDAPMGEMERTEMSKASDEWLFDHVSVVGVGRLRRLLWLAAGDGRGCGAWAIGACRCAARALRV
ncbi:hypothetical protein Cni_G08660 [Canna indica]|uniref:Uncharacterized protein n=1 Tax=Canna indica TaxID=4628 RepID=A0AAQ3K101_9LILI|nr:hypothetical protein Cni_G08660 [Canna indica]